MALIKCTECGKQFSDKAPACPVCGCPTKLMTNTNASKIICKLKGVNGQIDLYRNRLVIKRKGALAKMSYGFFKGEKEIFLNQISGIQLKKAGLLNGYIQFTISGGNEGTRGIMEATNDENTVMFNISHNSEAEILKRKIYELRDL